MRLSNKVKVGVLLAALVAGWWLMRGERINQWPITNAGAGRSGPIVALGDSITRGYGAPEGESYPDQLSQRLGVRVINQGVDGNTSGDGLARLDRDVLVLRPRVVLVCLGGNDILRRVPKETLFRNLEEIVGRIQKSGALVALIGMKGSTLLGVDYRKDYLDLARRTGCVHVPNIQQGIFNDPSLMSDQLHPNAKGYARMAERIEPFVRPHVR